MSRSRPDLPFYLWPAVIVGWLLQWPVWLITEPFFAWKSWSGRVVDGPGLLRPYDHWDTHGYDDEGEGGKQ